MEEMNIFDPQNELCLISLVLVTGIIRQNFLSFCREIWIGVKDDQTNDRTGWQYWSRENIAQVGDELVELSQYTDQLVQMQEHCCRIYEKHFSKNHIANEWDRRLRALLSSQHGTGG